jgi:hypothetical protein
VADLLTAYDKYTRSRELLLSGIDIELNSSLTVINYLENRLIWEELNHFKEKGVILGKHKLFSYLNRIREIRSMKIADLFRLKTSLEHNLVRNRANVRKDPRSPETEKRKARIEQMEKELIEINNLLNL